MSLNPVRSAEVKALLLIISTVALLIVRHIFHIA
nr:MAG TPA: hypothetical protein [Caudoviricetes sp.]